jgi:hypothetical protein
MLKEGHDSQIIADNSRFHLLIRSDLLTALDSTMPKM